MSEKSGPKPGDKRSFKDRDTSKDRSKDKARSELALKMKENPTLKMTGGNPQPVAGVSPLAKVSPQAVSTHVPQPQLERVVMALERQSQQFSGFMSTMSSFMEESKKMRPPPTQESNLFCILCFILH